MNQSKRLERFQKRAGTHQNTHMPSNAKSSIQWRVWLGFILVLLVILMDWQWVWGILFLFWVIPDIRNQVTYFMEPVERSNSPILYWTIVSTWILLSLFSISTLFIDYSQWI